MFAVIKTGGKQYRVAADDVITVEKLAGEPGDLVAFESVLLVGDGSDATIGAPLVDGASVAGEVVEQTRGPKLIAFKKRRRKNSRRKKGHRQDLTTVKITEILTGGAKPKAAKKADKPAAAKADEKKTDDKAKAESKKSEPKAAAKDDEVQALFETPKGDADDLKKISGVGPVLEKKLNALGITQYAQIANFSAEDIAKVDEVLNFKGRVEREDWVSQAKALMDDKA
ncbi:50S ribosomal protein L21 [Tepidamorphus sp. 3E244]|uniref:50S ribosomal protein L21 n=1 Tax=Tepidamorphus sp. 3E244 TaxID=3385498 RepID=UPI0038FD131F